MLCHIFDQAYLALADYVECETDIKRALAEDPKNLGVRLLQKEYKQKVGSSNLLHVEAAVGPAPHVSDIHRRVRLPPRKAAIHEVSGTEECSAFTFAIKSACAERLGAHLQSAESRKKDKALFSRMFKPSKVRMIELRCQPSSGSAMHVVPVTMAWGCTPPSHLLTLQCLNLQDVPATPVASPADGEMSGEKADSTTTAAQGTGMAEPMETESPTAGGSATNGNT